jgi:DNA transformation protein and related proteins
MSNVRPHVEPPMPRKKPIEFSQVKARPPGSDFAEYCCELLGSLGNVRAKRMFLGWGLSVDDLTVAVIAYDTLYLKCNSDTESKFLAASCKVFEHEAKGKVRRMQYYTSPESALESRIAMQPWANLAMQAAVAARKPTKVVRRRISTNAAKVVAVKKPTKSSEA